MRDAFEAAISTVIDFIVPYQLYLIAHSLRLQEEHDTLVRRFPERSGSANALINPNFRMPNDLADFLQLCVGLGRNRRDGRQLYPFVWSKAPAKSLRRDHENYKEPGRRLMGAVLRPRCGIHSEIAIHRNYWLNRPSGGGGVPVRPLMFQHYLWTTGTRLTCFRTRHATRKGNSMKQVARLFSIGCKRTRYKSDRSILRARAGGLERPCPYRGIARVCEIYVGCDAGWFLHRATMTGYTKLPF